MYTKRLSFTAFALSLPTLAWAQLNTARPPIAKRSGITRPAASSGFLAGADDCNAPHRTAGSGDMFDVPFSTGTTGPEGQSEANCYDFGTTGVDLDVWFDWTATKSGTTFLTTCAGTAVDTRLVIWPWTSSCPTDGSSLACNDDASCDPQSRAAWFATSGVSYTFQIGTFPGSSGGSGTFNVSAAPDTCGIRDDGMSENALGIFGAGGETGWLMRIECFQVIQEIGTAYGTPGAAAPPNGTTSRLAVYQDFGSDADPGTGTPPTLEWSIATTVTNGSTDIINLTPTGDIFLPTRKAWLLATADCVMGQFAGPMDESNPTPDAWTVHNTGDPGSLDLDDLGNNSGRPQQMSAIGLPTAWLLRASGLETPDETWPTCTGVTPCPCGNEPSDPIEGCVNSTGAGARLAATGTANLSNDTLVLFVNGVPNQPTLFFQGNTELLPPPTFGAGLRCCGEGVVRLLTMAPQGHCAATDESCGTQVGGIGGRISENPGNAALQPGDTRCYQTWFRDPGAGNPCPGSQFNLSANLVVSWTP